MNRRLARSIAFVGVLVVGFFAAVSFAAWTGQATGPGQSQARRSERVVVAGAAGPAELYPGGPAAAVHFTLTNDNPFNILFTSMTPGAVTSSEPTACPASNVTPTGATGLALASPAAATTGTLSIPGVLTMSPSAPDGCQAAVFSVSMTLNGIQSGLWTTQASGTTAQIGDLTFVDANRGWAVGGTAIRATVDGGATWTGQNPGIAAFAADFVDANTGWAVGGGGGIARTANGGASWSPQVSNTTALLNDVFFLDANRGWAVGAGQVIVGTTNGGATWAVQHDGPASNSINSVHFTDPMNGWAVESGGIAYRTGNGGATWTSVVLGSNMRAVVFADANRGWIGSFDGTVRRTVDGGATWSTTSWGGGGSLWNLHFSDANNGVAVGDGGVIRLTADGGATWTAAASPTAQTLLAVHAVSQNRIWAGGNNGTIVAYG